MKKLNIYGCSFSENLLEIEDIFTQKFDFTNYGKVSSSNFYIFDKFKETAEPNSTCIIQWSALTRPFDNNYSLLETSENPLFDLLEQWYILLEKTQEVKKERNIDLIQFVGWAMWKDSELNDYHREKLKSFDIIWYESNPQYDLIDANCFQFEPPNDWSSDINEDGLFYWDKLQWGGMSEWIRENVEMEKRYLKLDEPRHGRYFDPHPSFHGSKKFYEKSIFPLITNLYQI